MKALVSKTLIFTGAVFFAANCTIGIWVPAQDILPRWSIIGALAGYVVFMIGFALHVDDVLVATRRKS